MGDVWVGTIEQSAVGEAQLASLCGQIGAVLTQHYPGHFWMVGHQGGSIVVRNGYVGGDYGFYIHPDNSYSASDLAKKAVMYGGELLERANMRRGKANGEFATSLDGADPRRPIL